MKIDNNYIKELISALGYTQEATDIWQKQYKNHSNYTIQIDFKKQTIDYIDLIAEESFRIKVKSKVTSNFSKPENFVVLECVNRLLEKGYSPFSLVLENKWRVGGRLDILVNENDKAHLMIECKTWGNEFVKEKNRISTNGGQLFSYYQQDKNAQKLCLYTSKLLDNNKIVFDNLIVKIDDRFKFTNNKTESYDLWDKQFDRKGIFNDNIKPYEYKTTLVRSDLDDLVDKDESDSIYNQFMEILRHNVVSDEANAFNKIFNLFLCKIVDEDKKSNDELDFQWKTGDKEEDLIGRLNDLYKKGMYKFLKINVTDYSDEDLERIKDNVEAIRIIKEMRLYKNQEFAFTEVYNRDSFLQNAKIVKEIVMLLQNKRLRYTHKQQFLGDFFELLLGAGFKQKSGQFFTPVPLTRCIINSLPLEDIINAKIDNGDEDFLPYSIDFACGSGHFLTELMDELQNEINKLDTSKMTPKQLEKHNSVYKSTGFNWAEKFIYGIEKDYRLVKATKLACFLHGDGEAKIIHASGLSSFGDKDYKDKLLFSRGQDNEQFDLLVANPPFSVKKFVKTIKEHGEDSFTLFNRFSDKSKEIEILFIERMKQLVKVNGYAAIVLPITILTNGGVEEEARKMILAHFELKAILKLGSKAFMKTGTNTVVLFLRKRKYKLNLLNKEDYLNMAQHKTVLIVDSTVKGDEENFLGYIFKEKRGSEGIEETDGYLTNSDNKYDNKKASSYILRHLQGEKIRENEINENLKDHIFLLNMEDCFEFGRTDFKNTISLKKNL